MQQESGKTARKFFVLLLYLCSVGVLPHMTPQLCAQPSSPPPLPRQSPLLTADNLLAFAEQLMREQEYFRAITEYQRFLFHYPEDTRQALVRFRIGVAFYQGQSYGEALATFRDVTQRYPDTAYGNLAWLWQGEVLIRQAQYGSAEQVYTKIEQRFPGDEIGQYARYRRGWTFLYRQRWEDASQEFKRITPTASVAPLAQRLAEEVLDGRQLPSKSPLLAGLFSGVVPGGGQLYNGRFGDALLSFFLNSLFIFGIVEAIDSKEFAIAGVLSLFESGWYIGNIYGAVNGAHKLNRHTTETFLRNLENRFPTTSPQPQSSQLFGLRFSLRF